MEVKGVGKVIIEGVIVGAGVLIERGKIEAEVGAQVEEEEIVEARVEAEVEAGIEKVKTKRGKGVEVGAGVGVGVEVQNDEERVLGMRENGRGGGKVGRVEGGIKQPIN